MEFKLVALKTGEPPLQIEKCWHVFSTIAGPSLIWLVLGRVSRERKPRRARQTKRMGGKGSN